MGNIDIKKLEENTKKCEIFFSNAVKAIENKQKFDFSFPPLHTHVHNSLFKNVGVEMVNEHYFIIRKVSDEHWKLSASDFLKLAKYQKLAYLYTQIRKQLDVDTSTYMSTEEYISRSPNSLETVDNVKTEKSSISVSVVYDGAAIYQQAYLDPSAKPKLSKSIQSQITKALEDYQQFSSELDILFSGGILMLPHSKNAYKDFKLNCSLKEMSIKNKDTIYNNANYNLSSFVNLNQFSGQPGYIYAK